LDEPEAEYSVTCTFVLDKANDEQKKKKLFLSFLFSKDTV